MGEEFLPKSFLMDSSLKSGSAEQLERDSLSNLMAKPAMRHGHSQEHDALSVVEVDRMDVLGIERAGNRVTAKSMTPRAW